MGKYKDRDTSGWAQTSAGAVTYNATFRLNKTITSISGASSSSKQDVKVTLNTNTGNYDVYEKNVLGDTLIYQYNASNNKTVIKNESFFGSFFAGDSGRTSQLRNINLGARESNLALIDKNATTDVQRNNYINITSYEGYRPLEDNTSTAAPDRTEDDQENVAPANSNNTGVEDPNDSTNVDDAVSTAERLTLVPETDFREPVANRGLVLRYPKEIPDLGYDFIRITAYNYVTSGLPSLSNQRTQSASRVLTDPLETVILPMQPNLSTSQSVDWGGDKLDALKGSLGEAAMGAIDSISEFDIAGLAKVAQGAAGNFKKALEDSGTKQALIAYFAGQAVGANIQGRTTGQVLNPNLELLFTGPRMRTFQFNFVFTPRDEDEAITIRKIIKTFKRNFSPQRSTSGLFLKTPRVFQIEYIFDDSETSNHPFLNKIKPCAMTSFNVNYTPDGSYSTFPDGSMTSYAISMSFGELQPIYADEYDNSDDMGF